MYQKSGTLHKNRPFSDKEDDGMSGPDLQPSASNGVDAFAPISAYDANLEEEDESLSLKKWETTVLLFLMCKLKPTLKFLLFIREFCNHLYLF